MDGSLPNTFIKTLLVINDRNPPSTSLSKRLGLLSLTPRKIETREELGNSRY